MDVTLVTVVFNTRRLLQTCLDSFVSCYGERLPIVVVDGSTDLDEQHANARLCRRLRQASHVSAGYNIHHGPGLHLALVRLVRTPYALAVDTDVAFVAPGLLEEASRVLRPETIYAGELRHQDYSGYDDFNAARFDRTCLDPIPYIHPHCMFVRTRAYACTTDGRRTRPFLRHGSPCLATMIDLKHAGDSAALQCLPDLDRYRRHPYRGTAGLHGYALEGRPAKLSAVDLGALQNVPLWRYLLAQAAEREGRRPGRRVHHAIRAVLRATRPIAVGRQTGVTSG